MGGPFPSGHTNVQPYDYQRPNPTTISAYVGNRADQYIRRAENGDISFIRNTYLTNYWRRWFIYFRDSVVGFSREQQKEAALIRTRGDLIDGTANASYNISAQTRIVASYGFLQITDYTATDLTLNGYTKTAVDKLPENLNDQSVLMLAYVQ